MTSLIELAVVDKFIKSIVLSSSLKDLEVLENDFCDNKLGLPNIM